jgi:uncharacterized protein
MSKKILLLTISILLVSSINLPISQANTTGQIYEGKITLNYRNVTVYAPAVAQTDQGYIGVISTITVTIQNGSGRVFVDTLPLTQIDMQGSARLAVKVAGALVTKDKNCIVDPSKFDYFFVVRTSSPIIGGPSAGAVMTVAAIALLENLTITDKTVMTGMINPDGSIGPIGGIQQKIDAAYSVGANRFLIPKGQANYTETVSELANINGWPQIVTKRIPKSYADYAMNTYGMELVEIEDISDAVYYFTGYEFQRIDYNQNITTSDYLNSMKPLATTLLEEATSMFNNVSTLLDNSSIPNYYPSYYGSQISDFLDDSKTLLMDSKGDYNETQYYSSTSHSFLSLIYSRLVKYACEYYNSENKDQYMSSLLNEVTEFYNDKEEKAVNAEINGMITLQCVGIAQSRASEAESYIIDATNNYNNYNYDWLGTLYYIAFGYERSRSVEWWLGISSYFNDTGNINVSIIENLALEYIEDAQQSTIYSSVILQEIGEISGKPSSYLSDAEEMLATAREDYEKNYPAAAFIEALEALVKANLAIEIIDAEAEEKIQRSKERARASISESRSLGIEPVVAISYYEYAESLVEKANYDSGLVYFKLSDIIAGAIGFTNYSIGTITSRYAGIPEFNNPSRFQGIFGYINDMIIIAILGAIAGLGVGLIIGGITLRKENQEIYNKWVPRSINDYYKKKDNKFQYENHVPRSIKDYYKKKK